MKQHEINQKQADRLPEGYSLFCWLFNARASELGWGVKDIAGNRIIKGQSTAKKAVDKALAAINS